MRTLAACIPRVEVLVGMHGLGLWLGFPLSRSPPSPNPAPRKLVTPTSRGYGIPQSHVLEARPCGAGTYRILLSVPRLGDKLTEFPSNRSCVCSYENATN
jgi:hypothetical protein